MKMLTAAIFILLLSAPSYATQQTNNNPLVDQIIRDVVDYAVDEGKRVLKDNTGVDLRGEATKIGIMRQITSPMKWRENYDS